jgi:glutamine amidotransferase
VIALVDYGAGNLTSVRKALAALDAAVWMPGTPGELMRASGIIVPGVGHFDATIPLGRTWRAEIRAALDRQVPILGICVGMQWLFDGSTEAPAVEGLALIGGTCVHLGDGQTAVGSRGSGDRPPGSAQPPDPDAPVPAPLKVPHVGWNSLSFPRASRLFEGVTHGTQVYFTHSYAAPVVAATVAVTTYGVPFSAAVEEGLVSGVQFHPEKSGDAGLRILKNWVGSL